MKERDTNIELLRILSMCGVVCLHYISAGNGGMIQNAVFPNFSWFFYQGVESLCVPLVNCFVLISGFYMIRKTVFSFRKVIDLLIITAEYGVAAYFISIVLGVESFSIIGVVYSLFPYFSGSKWFVETYIILLLLAPFLNKLLLYLSRKNYRLLLGIWLILFSVWYSVGLSAPVLDDGYGILNFISLYMIGGYIARFYGELSWMKLRIWKYGAAYIVLVLITFGFSYFINPFGYCFITNICAASALFLLFKKLKMPVHRKINRLAAGAFDVYQVHSNAGFPVLVQNLLRGGHNRGHILGDHTYAVYGYCRLHSGCTDLSF